MPHLTGSDELFRLIHSLNTEEKGYFRKFALRHTPEGNDYLKLFDAINKQPEFEDAGLKKSFRNYSRKKLYLKEILIECLLVYHRNSHPHISLLGQLQKIHLLVIKGLYDEAFKMMDKAIDKCRRMELFAVLRYLLHLNFELRANTFNRTEDLEGLEITYRHDTRVNIANELNLNDAELLSVEWLVQIKRNTPEKSSADLKAAESATENYATQSLRAEIRKLNTLFYLGFLQNDPEKRYEITKKQVALVQRFRSKHDASFNIVPVLSNHIVNCIELKKFTEAESLCNKMIASEAKVKLYYDMAFTWGNLYKWTLYFHTARFEKGLADIASTQHEMLHLYDSISDEMRQRTARVYDKIKIVLLFCNKAWKECWLFIHDSLSTLKQDETCVADLQMILMMVQLEMGNFELLRSMAIKAEKKLRQKNIHDETYITLIGFFKQVSASTVRKQAFHAWSGLRSGLKESGAPAREAFDLLKYEYWLETKFSDKSFGDLIKAGLKNKSLHIQGETLIAS